MYPQMNYANTNTLNFDYIMAMTIMPIIMASVTEAIKKIFYFFGEIFMYIYNFLKSKYAKKYDKYSIRYLVSTSSYTKQNPQMFSMNYDQLSETMKAIYYYFDNNKIIIKNNIKSDNGSMNIYIPDNYEISDKSNKQYDLYSDEVIKHNDIEFQFVKNVTLSDSHKTETTHIVLSSYKKNTNELMMFVGAIKDEYRKKFMELAYGLCVMNSMGSFDFMEIDKSQTFDNLFFSNKEQILNDLKQHENVEHYKKFGLKRKLSYIFYGPHGSAKTSTITAIANHLKNRDIIHVPIANVKTNGDLYNILYRRVFGHRTCKSDEIIICFDEIDSLCGKKLKKNYENKTSKYKHPRGDDALDVGIMLSFLDGFASQDGMIIIATANNIDNLDEALIRNGRFKLMIFEHVGRQEIKSMIEKYQDVELTQNQIDKIRDDKVINSLTIKELCINYNEQSIDDLIDQINLLVPINKKNNADNDSTCEKSEDKTENKIENKGTVENNEDSKNNKSRHSSNSSEESISELNRYHRSERKQFQRFPNMSMIESMNNAYQRNQMMIQPGIDFCVDGGIY